MNNSYESNSVTSSNSSYDLNTGFHIEESFQVSDSMLENYYLEATQQSEAPELKSTKKFTKNCKKICSNLIKPISNKINKLKSKNSDNRVKESISEDNKIKLQFPEAPRQYIPAKCEVNFNSDQFANVGDIFYCYI